MTATVATKPAILLNDGQPIQSELEIDFLLRSLLRGGEVPEDLRQLAVKLWKENSALTHDAVLRRLNEEAVSAKPPELPRWKRWLGLSGVSRNGAEPASLKERFAAHFAEAQSAYAAYAAHLKPKPEAVWWPNPDSQTAPASVFATRPYLSRQPLIDKTTPIGSAGSCFAMEIAHWLQRNGFNYLITEPPRPGDAHQLPMFNARWGILFNAPSLRQLVERSFGVIETPRVVWTLERDGREKIFDPFREDILFDSIEEYEADYDDHVRACRQALSEAKLFIMTLGMNEVWFLKGSGHALSRAPWRVASSCVEQRVLTVEENVRHLSRMWKTWKQFNPSLRLILTVSPVPLHATFRGDAQHVVVANCHSKSVLRVAAEEFVSTHEDVFYFPAYETVTYCTKDPWDTDERHVSRRTVENVMQTFSEMFVQPES